MGRSRKEKYRRQRRKFALILFASSVALSALFVGSLAIFLIWQQSPAAREPGDGSGREPGYDVSQTANPGEGNQGTPVPSGSPITSGTPAPAEATEPSQPDQSEEPDIEAIVDEEGTVLTLAFVGDVIFASTVETMLRRNGYDFPYKALQEELRTPDITVANLETPITTRGEPEDKQYAYRSHPDALAPFKEAGFDVVSLANNHILDYGVEGLLDTLDHLDEAGILRTGAGRELTEAYRPAIIEKNGVRVAFLSFSHKVPETWWKAEAGRPGTAELYSTRLAMEAIADAREQADIVVVLPHWGTEREDQPEDRHRQMARDFIDAGADLVVGNHPHVLQGLEQYKGKWIAYSLGNFLFTTNDFEPSWETIILNVAYTLDGEFRLSAVPVLNKFANPVRMEQDEAEALFRRLTSISYGVVVDDQGNITAVGQ